MARIICTKCGMAGNSKCPHCRTIFSWDRIKIPGSNFLNEEVPIGMIDSAMSHRLTIHEDKLEFKIYSKADKPETAEEAMIFIWGLLKDLPESAVKMLVCSHDWTFAPFEKSDIGCGHRSEETPLLDYMANAWAHLIDGTTYSPEGSACSICRTRDRWCEHIKEPEQARDDSDRQAASIINQALDAIDKGVDWKYEG